jgi:hypothetical protein
MKIEDFGKKIKVKYPQYQDIPDAELGQKMIMKYPVYKDLIDEEIAQPEGRSGIGGVATGFVKKTASTLQNLGKVGIEAVTLGKADTGKLGISNETLKLEGTAEKVGGFASDVASFAVPGGRAGKLATSLGARVATEAVIGGGVTALQQGKVDRNAIDAAIISAAFPVVGKAFQAGRKLTQSAQKELAPRVVNSLIKPLQRNLSYGKNPGRAVAELGITANNLDELAEKISVARNEVGEQLGAIYESSDKIFDISDFLKPIDESIKKASNAPRTNSALITRLQALKDDLLGVEVNELGEELATRKLQGVTANEVFNFKKDIGNLTKYTGNASDDNMVNSSLQQVYGKLKGKLDDALPDTMPLNERYGDLTSAEIATKYRDKIMERQNLIKFDMKVTGLGTGLVTAIASGGAALPSVVFGLGAAGLQKAFESPRVKTEFAKWLAGASAAEKKALFDKAPWAKAIITRSVVGSD